MKKKTYVLTLSKTFMKGHPRQGEPTGFKEKYLRGEKIHTIREGLYWKKVVDEVNAGLAVLSVREWSAKPYDSKQVEIDRLERLGWQGYKLLLKKGLCRHYIEDKQIRIGKVMLLAEKDGLEYNSFMNWFPKPFTGGIIHFTDFRY